MHNSVPACHIQVPTNQTASPLFCIHPALTSKKSSLNHYLVGAYNPKRRRPVSSQESHANARVHEGVAMH